MNQCEVCLRNYQPSDLEEIEFLFYESVEKLCSGQYDATQRKAWVSGFNRETWGKTLSEHWTRVAWLDGRIVGFLDLNGDLLDRLYVHPSFSGQGIGKTLVSAVEGEAVKRGVSLLRTEASLTARPFFEHLGFEVRNRQLIQRQGVWLTNFLMEKSLDKGEVL